MVPTRLWDSVSRVCLFGALCPFLNQPGPPGMQSSDWPGSGAKDGAVLFKVQDWRKGLSKNYLGALIPKWGPEAWAGSNNTSRISSPAHFYPMFCRCSLALPSPPLPPPDSDVPPCLTWPGPPPDSPAQRWCCRGRFSVPGELSALRGHFLRTQSSAWCARAHFRVIRGEADGRGEVRVWGQVGP